MNWLFDILWLFNMCWLFVLWNVVFFDMMLYVDKLVKDVMWNCGVYFV